MKNFNGIQVPENLMEMTRLLIVEDSAAILKAVGQAQTGGPGRPGQMKMKRWVSTLLQDPSRVRG